mgnify:CR=1 FL=1
MKLRIGLGSCGIAAGGKKVREALLNCLKENNMNIKITSTGCIGMCFYEPIVDVIDDEGEVYTCLLYTSPSPRDRTRYRMPSSA